MRTLVLVAFELSPQLRVLKIHLAKILELFPRMLQLLHNEWKVENLHVLQCKLQSGPYGDRKIDGQTGLPLR